MIVTRLYGCNLLVCNTQICNTPFWASSYFVNVLNDKDDPQSTSMTRIKCAQIDWVLWLRDDQCYQTCLLWKSSFTLSPASCPCPLFVQKRGASHCLYYINRVDRSTKRFVWKIQPSKASAQINAVLAWRWAVQCIQFWLSKGCTARLKIGWKNKTAPPQICMLQTKYA